MILQEPSGELRFTNWNVKTANGTDLQMRFGMKVTITKGLTWNQYPLDKLQFFNFKPFELLVYTKSDKCQDDPKQNDVTCNWYYFHCLSSQLHICIQEINSNLFGIYYMYIKNHYLKNYIK